jgi:hypothetical protein
MKTDMNSKSESKGTGLNTADFARARLAGILGLLPIAAVASILAFCASVDSTTAQYVGAPHYAPSDPKLTGNDFSYDVTCWKGRAVPPGSSTLSVCR